MPRVKISLIFEFGARIGPGKARLLEIGPRHRVDFGGGARHAHVL